MRTTAQRCLSEGHPAIVPSFCGLAQRGSRPFLSIDPRPLYPPGHFLVLRGEPP
jgi:hypothetical protein